jgi:predicted amidohydrolase YtcJ
MQLPDQRLPNLSELDAVNRPIYLNAAQGGVRTNSLGKAWLEGRGVTVAPDGAVAAGPAGAAGATLALRLIREQFLTPESRKRGALEALRYYAGLGITTHLDNGAFHSDMPSGGVANENTYTMHNPFVALAAEKRMPARLRFNYLHQDPPNDPTLPTLSQRLKNSLPFFGNDWIRSGGIGEFTGGGINGLKAIAAAGWRAEDHTLNLASFQALVESREMVNAQIPIANLHWVISHVPQVTEDLVNRFKALGGGLLVGWGPLRTGTNVGPAYRMLIANGIPLGYHSDGGDITVINPWLNFYTMITGRNLKGDLINEGQTLTRAEVLWLATAANKWFIGEDDLGSIEVGNHADVAVLDRDYFTVPDEDIKHIRSVLTIVGGKIVSGTGAL